MGTSVSQFIFKLKMIWVALVPCFFLVFGVFDVRRMTSNFGQ